MRTGSRKESFESRGSTSWNDGLHPIDGGGDSNGSIAPPEGFGTGTGGSGREGTDVVSKTTWFTPVDEVSDCPGGVCPVPWAKGVEALASSEFLSEDRDSNFPGENTIEERPLIQPDEVNHPPHYTDGGIECIEAIEASLTPEEFRGYCKGNLMKYGWRERLKGGTKSLKKAQWYLDRLIQFDEAQNG
jgi:hypothetical protein